MAAPPENGSPHHPLAHLPVCPDCTFYLTAPILCTGQNTPEFDGLWYRKCFHNFPPVDTSCQAFQWTDLPPGVDAHPQLQVKCSGLGCKVARSPNPVNINCLMGLCKQCCIRAQATVPGLRSCTVSSHNHGRRRGRAPARPPPAVPPPLIVPGWAPPLPPGPPAPVQQPAAPLAHGQQAPVAPPPAAPVAAPEPLPPPAAAAVAPPMVPQVRAGGPATIDPALLTAAHLPVRPARPSYRQSVSPIYQARFQTLDSAQITIAQDATDEARFHQQLGHTKMLEFWNVDGGASQGYTVRIPHWPGFHPKDSPELVEAYGVDKQACQYWDDVKCRWWNCSPTSPPRNVKVLDVLYYRAIGVTKGIDMPGLSDADVPATPTSLGKRRADNRPDLPFHRSGSSMSIATPRKRFAMMPPTPCSSQSSRSWPVTPSSRDSPWQTPPGTPSTSSSRLSVTPSMPRNWTSTRPLRDTSPSPLSRASSFGDFDDVDDDLTYTDSPPASVRALLEDARLEASGAFSAHSAGSSARSLREHSPEPSSLGSSAMATPPRQTSASTLVDFDPATVDLSTAPRGPRGVWPLRYVNDMAAGFARMRYLEDHAQMKRIPAFELAFGVEFKRSTFHQNFTAWNNAEEVPGEQQRWISYGHDHRGEWALFYRAWRAR